MDAYTLTQGEIRVITKHYVGLETQNQEFRIFKQKIYFDQTKKSYFFRCMFLVTSGENHEIVWDFSSKTLSSKSIIKIEI